MFCEQSPCNSYHGALQIFGTMLAKLFPIPPGHPRLESVREILWKWIAQPIPEMVSIASGLANRCGRYSSSLKTELLLFSMLFHGLEGPRCALECPEPPARLLVPTIGSSRNRKRRVVDSCQFVWCCQASCESVSQTLHKAESLNGARGTCKACSITYSASTL